MADINAGQRIKDWIQQMGQSRSQLFRAALTIFTLVFLIYGIYLLILFKQLQTAFINPEEFIPTKIFSSVTHIDVPQKRSYIESRLKSLGYNFFPSEESIVFTLREIDYPHYLIPEGHITLELAEKSIILEFENKEDDEGKVIGQVLSSIAVEDEEISDFYLEPELVATLSRSSEATQIRDVITFNDPEFPDKIWKAIMAIEDRNFREHYGISLTGLARALVVNIKTMSFAQGGSTLTQQLVKNLMARRGKNLFKKLNELFLALLLEIKFNKEQILERYLNEIYLGQIGNLEIHGIAEGAKYFFGKRVKELNLAEIALMAGLIRGPGYYSPYRHWDRALKRQRLVLLKMVENNFIAQEEMNEALELPIRLQPPPTAKNKAPYFTDFVKAELIRQLASRLTEQEITNSGFRVYTTLDMPLNRIAQKSVTNGVARLQNRLKAPEYAELEGALAAVDHSNGHIKVLIGGKNYRRSTFNRILNMKRSVGSTFKPIVYITSFESGFDEEDIPMGPGYPLEDSPWKLTFDRGLQNWEPKNYHEEYRGWVTVREALAHSINVPAARLGVNVGIDSIIETAKALGVTSDLPEVPSLVLGVAELSPIELLRVYATIANRGVQDELTVILGIVDPSGSNYAHFSYYPEQVFDVASIDLMTDLLQDVFEYGTAKAAKLMGFDRPAAGKTGTTSLHRDSWFAGFTPQMTAVSWVGVEEGESTINLTGAGAALPIWVDFMNQALAGEPAIPFQPSEYLTTLRIDRHSGKLATSDCDDEQVVIEKYIVGREPELAACEEEFPPSEDETDVSETD